MTTLKNKLVDTSPYPLGKLVISSGVTIHCLENWSFHPVLPFISSMAMTE